MEPTLHVPWWPNCHERRIGDEVLESFKWFCRSRWKSRRLAAFSRPRPTRTPTPSSSLYKTAWRVAAVSRLQKQCFCSIRVRMSCSQSCKIHQSLSSRPFRIKALHQLQPSTAFRCTQCAPTVSPHLDSRMMMVVCALCVYAWSADDRTLRNSHC